MSPFSVEIYIDELVLEGFNPADRYKISEAITAELTRLFEERLFTEPGPRTGSGPITSGLTPAKLGQSYKLTFSQSLTESQSMAQLDAGSFQLAQDASPERIGTQVAGSLWKSMAAWESVTLDESATLNHNTSGGKNE